MKRVRDFRITYAPIDKAVSKSLMPTSEDVSGWHHAWDTAVSRLSSTCTEASIGDVKSRQIIARFSREDAQTTQEGSLTVDVDGRVTGRLGFPRWQSTRIEGLSDEYFENRNTTDFQWHLLEGATHEVPFRLGYLERMAQRHPDGVFSYCLTIVDQVRDMVHRQPSQVS